MSPTAALRGGDIRVVQLDPENAVIFSSVRGREADDDVELILHL